jgi:hypothetical protein
LLNFSLLTSVFGLITTSSTFLVGSSFFCITLLFSFFEDVLSAHNRGVASNRVIFFSLGASIFSIIFCTVLLPILSSVILAIFLNASNAPFVFGPNFPSIIPGLNPKSFNAI